MTKTAFLLELVGYFIVEFVGIFIFVLVCSLLSIGLLIDEAAYNAAGAPIYDVVVAPVVALWWLWGVIAFAAALFVVKRQERDRQGSYLRVINELYRQLLDPNYTEEEKNEIRFRLHLIERNQQQPLIERQEN
jgi:hypothetical protein